MEGGGALAALEAMKAHPKEAGVQVGKEEGEAEAWRAWVLWGQMEALLVPVPIPIMAQAL